MLLPETVFEDYYLLVSRLAFFRQESAPASGLHAQHIEKALGHTVPWEPVQMHSVRDVEVVLLNGDQLLADLILLAPVCEDSRRDCSTYIADRQILLPYDNQPRLIWKGERPQDERINGTKDGRVGADAQRQRNHRDSCESGTFQKAPNPAANVPNQCFHTLLRSFVPQRHQRIDFRCSPRRN